MRIGWFLALVGCASSFEDGVAVGNPTMDAEVAARLAPADPVALTSARLQVLSVDFTSCDGLTTLILRPGTVDLLGGVVLPVPEGAWCTVAWSSGGDLELKGAGGRLEGALPWPSLRFSLDPEAAVGTSPANVLEFASPGWLAPIADEVAAGGEVHLTVEHPAFDVVMASITTDSALWTDDGDGVLSESERIEGAIGTGDSFTPVGDDDTADTDL